MQIKCTAHFLWYIIYPNHILSNHCIEKNFIVDINFFKPFYRWTFVIHGGINGFSRLIVYLGCSTNNRASTMFQFFEQAVQTHVHNQRIERLWRNLFAGCTYTYYHLFYALEDSGLLDPSNEIHLCALHYVYTPRINQSL